MGQNVDANGRSILHKGHGMTHTCAVPDVCKTPTPGGPVPIPYVNIAMDSDITDGAETVKIEGNPVANLGAKISTSTGDEAGSAGGGIISSKIKGTVTWKMGSLDVKAEGKSVVRFLDQDFHNGNACNTVFIAPGDTCMSYGDDFTKPCPVCQKNADAHVVKETENSAALCAKLIEALKNKFKELGQGVDPDNRREIARWEWDKGTRTKRWTGYMVGVMVCKHKDGVKPRTCADMSGNGIKNEFRNVASKIVDVVVGGGGEHGGKARAATADDVINANTSNAPAGLSAEQQKAIRDTWDKVSKKKGEGYPGMGICAGQHLVN